MKRDFTLTQFNFYYTHELRLFLRKLLGFYEGQAVQYFQQNEPLHHPVYLTGLSLSLCVEVKMLKARALAKR